MKRKFSGKFSDKNFVWCALQDALQCRVEDRKKGLYFTSKYGEAYCKIKKGKVYTYVHNTYAQTVRIGKAFKELNYDHQAFGDLVALFD